MLVLALLACAPDSAAPPTWSGAVRAIVAEECAACHVDGGGTPFPLTTYAEAAPLAEAMAASVEAGRMPPWPADPACRSFVGERVVADEQAATLRAWADAGAPEGEATAPIVGTSTAFEATETLAPEQAYTPDFSSSDDDYHCFVLDRRFDEETFLTASRVIPGSAQVHHVFLFILSGAQVAQMEALDAAEEGPGYSCFGSPVSAGEGISVLDAVGGIPEMATVWAPGAEPLVAPAGGAWGIPAGARLVIQVHYAKVGDAAPDLTAVEAVFDEATPAVLVRSRPLFDTSFEIPAGDAEVTATRTVTNWTGEDVVVHALLPHMHLLGERLTAEIGRGDGGADCLVDVPEWDFDWQLMYALAEDETVAPEETLTLSCTWDNSAENQPMVDGEQAAPEDVGWGEGTRDEMCLLYMQHLEPYAPLPAADEAACADAEACVAGCDPASFDCLASCEEADLTCTLCGVQAVAGCGGSACVAEGLAMRDCLVTCSGGAVAFGGGLGACLNATCPSEYAELLACVDPLVSDGTCDEALATCGVVYPE